MNELILPPDWVTAHLPHNIQTVRTGIFKSTRLTCCACGITIGRGSNMYNVHWAKELEMRAWLKTVYKTRSRPNNNFFN